MYSWLFYEIEVTYISGKFRFLRSNTDQHVSPDPVPRSEPRTCTTNLCLLVPI